MKEIAEIQKALVDAVNAIDENLPTLAVSKIWYARDSLALISARETFAWESGLKAGVDAIRLSQKPMIEALEGARKDLHDCLTVIDLYAGATVQEAEDDLKEHPYLAKIDAALKEASHE